MPWTSAQKFGASTAVLSGVPPDGTVLAGSDGTSIRRLVAQSGAELPGLPSPKKACVGGVRAGFEKIAASVRGSWELASGTWRREP